jgi:cytochrome c oxidase subunit 2
VTVAERGPGDGLWRWIVAGLAVGAVLLGLLAAAYAIGREQGREHAGGARPVTAPAAPAPAAPTTAPPASGAALVAQGEAVFASAGCAGCHSLDGSAGVGPSLQGIAGRQVTLADGRTLRADEDYLAESISQPDDAIVEGYSPGAMPALGLSDSEVDALVAFLRSGP